MDGNLRSITVRQKELLAELEREVKHIENSDISKENERLKAELAKLNAEYIKAEQAAMVLSEQNAGLTNALYEQVHSEKVRIIDNTKEKLDIYFKNTFETEQNRLHILANSIKSRIDSMTAALRSNNADLDGETSRKLGELALQVNIQITEARTRYAQAHGAFSENERIEFEKLKNEQISEEQIIAATKKNNLERFVGLNLLNKIGILLIIIGVITAAHYTYVLLSDTLKGIMMFTLGAIMLAGGELLNRKKPNIFSLGITAGGAGVLYAALAISYFGLEIIGMYPALGICVIITAVTFILSTRYDSQTILIFALVGGYLPIFTILDGSSIAMIYGAMVYFIVLNLLALMVAFKRKWTVAAFAGMSLNIFGTAVICAIVSYIQAEPVSKFITIAYVFIAFLVYSLIPIVGSYKDKLRIKNPEVVLLAINTFFSSLIVYIMFYSFNWDEATGLLAAAFAAVYLLLGYFFERKFSGEKHMRALFYMTGLIFFALIIPFQFGRVWLTFGWLVQGVALTAYGILMDAKVIKRVGYAINGLCLGAFIAVDLMENINFLFAWKYLAITAGSLIILGAYMVKKMMAGGWQRSYKNLAIINLWFYALYICYKLHELTVGDPVNNGSGYYDITYLCMALAVLLTFLIAYFAPRIKILSDFGTKMISILLYTIGIVWLLIINGAGEPYYGEAQTSVVMLGTAALVFISLISVFAARDLMKLLVMGRKLGVEWYPLTVSAYFVIMLTQALISQYGFSFASAWISIIYVLTALAWIIFGFAKRYSFIRKAGLGLALLTVIKLFIIDLASLTQGYRIISYFTLGVTLVAISFVYQYFNKRLELKIGSGKE